MSPTYRFSALVYTVALFLRLVPILLTRSLGIGLDDMFQYDMLARSLASGNGYRWYARADLSLLEPYVKFDLSSAEYDPVRGVPTSFRAPLYPGFLALVYSISGTGFGRFFAARIAQAALLGAPLAPLTYFAARSLLNGRTPDGAATGNGALPDRERAARRAAWIMAVYPLLLIFPLGLGTENLFFLLVLVSVLGLLKLAEKPATGRFLLAGFLLGLAALTRSVILPFAGLAVLWTWFSLREKRGAALMAAALTLTVLPWVIRNSVLHERPTGIETSLGYNLYVGYHPQSDGSFTFGPSLDLVPILDDALRDRLGTQKALEFIRADPGRFLPLALSRLGHFFRLELRVLTYFYSSNFFGHLPFPLLLTLAAFFGLPFAVLSLSSAFGAAWLPPNRSSLLLLLLFAGYLAPHVLILSEERFHLTLVPFMAILAAHFWTLGLPAVPARFRASRSGRLAVLAAGLACVFLLFNWGFQLTTDAAKFVQLLGPHGNQTYFPY